MFSYNPHIGYDPQTKPWEYKKYPFKAADTMDLFRIAKCAEKYAWSSIIWKDGVKIQDNFIEASLCVLDCDSPDFSLEEALNAFCDMQHVIGTTRSHQKEKNGIICDHFRVVIPFDSKITDRDIYEFNMRNFGDRYGADKNSTESSRFFYPCKEIISVNHEGFTVEVLPLPVGYRKDPTPEQYLANVLLNTCEHANGKGLPIWVKSFLDQGKLFSSGRNSSAYSAALTMFEHGYDKEEIKELINKSPFCKEGLKRNEISVSINSAAKKFIKNMGIKNG